MHQIELTMQNEELAQTQVELEKTRDRYIDLYDFAPVGYLTLSEQGIILEANLAAASLLGVERNKLVKQRLDHFVYGGDQDAYYFYRRRLFEAHTQLTEEVRLSRSGSAPFYALLAGLVTQDKGKMICRLSISDISQRKGAEKALAENEERFRTMTDFTQDWEYWLGPEMEFVYISPSCEAISGYSIEEFRSDPSLVSKIVHPDDREAWKKHELSYQNSSQPGSLDLRILTPSGRVCWIHHLCRPVYSNSGKWLGRRVSNRDITERKSAEKEREKLIDQLRYAREIQRMLSQRVMDAQENERRQIARELHDEIGQALTALKLNLQTVQRRQKDVLDLSESIGMAERMLQQVRAISLNLRPPMLDDLGLAPALRWLLDCQGGDAGLNVSFVNRLKETRLAPEIEIACFRVAQEALTNVARHAQAEQVKVELAQDEHELYLTIQDNGRGFDLQAADEHAWQGRSAGLVGMRERVHLAGGRLEIKSNPQEGTQIRACFPLDQQASCGEDQEELP